MLKFNNVNTSVVADNKVILCDLEYMLTDDEAMKIKSILDGLVSQRGGSGIVSTGQTAYKAVQSPVTTQTTASAAKKVYTATKDFSPKYEIKELESTDGIKLFCISRKNGWTRAEKGLMNQAIKALKGIKEIEVAGIRKDKDGNEKSITFKAWGYNTDSTAKKHLKELPTVFTADQLNNFGK